MKALCIGSGSVFRGNKNREPRRCTKYHEG